MSEQTINFEGLADNPDFPGVRDVSAEEVQKNLSQLTLIDVRRPDEYTGELGHIDGAELLTLDFLPQQIDELPKDKTIVFICRSGRRSAQASAFAAENGLDKTYNLLGGMILWNEKNLPVVEKSE